MEYYREVFGSLYISIIIITIFRSSILIYTYSQLKQNWAKIICQDQEENHVFSTIVHKFWYNLTLNRLIRLLHWKRSPEMGHSGSSYRYFNIRIFNTILNIFSKGGTHSVRTFWQQTDGKISHWGGIPHLQNLLNQVEILHSTQDVVPILLSSGRISNAQHAHPQQAGAIWDVCEKQG